MSRKYGWIVAVGLFALAITAFAAEETGVSKSAGPPAADEALLLGDLPVVEAAALRVQTLREAPANVTVVTAAEIQKYGYRTLAEILDSVRGLYVTNDHMYRFVGARGLSLPGDFNTRFLVMLNGHPLTENVYNSNGFFGQDFGLDVDLIERVEVIRGPTSALYGSNGVLANINVITKSPVDQPALRVSMETGSFGEKKTGFTTSQYLGKGVNLLLSGSVFQTAGQSMFLPGYGSPEAGGAVAHNLDKENGYHSFAQLLWGNWNVTAYFNSRRVVQPQSIYDSQFNNPGNTVLDQRNFVSLDYSRQVGANRRLRWKTAYDQYRYRDVFNYDEETEGAGVSDVRDSNWGDWLTTRLSLSTPVRRFGTLTAGSEVYQELRNLQLIFQTAPVAQESLRISRPNRGFAVFAQQEVPVTKRWKIYAGLRQDYSRNFQWFTAPRVSAVFDQSHKLTYKLSYARAFRNPSTYEKYYEDEIYQLRNLNLHQERTHAFEASVERPLGRMNAVVNTFHYRMADFIQSDLLENGFVQYRNSGQIRLTGVEAEVGGSPVNWIETSASAVYQRSDDLAKASRLVNSPSVLGKARLGIPVFKRRGTIGFALRSWNSRLTGAGERLASVVLLDSSITTAKHRSGLQLAAGIRNLVGRNYENPVDLTLDQIRANGRTWYVRLSWRSKE